ncbi:hypothetical protein J7438_21455 [Thalassotalea sp. G20_0]|uniref:hypothetical protein n=1 Tax=Thalassotalea sp. G20_0 TaxID=2821093 RepID=UPI001ADB369D|nr:hypothetical protein [Thalassotalea sp. G20_0]MBO9496629.1 hypothetical protein [Thalassotalea sp. G20_0]
MSITILDSKEICLDESFELSVRPETFQKADRGTESEIEIVRVWSMAGEDGSHAVNNSHQYSNVVEQISPIIHADNLGNKSVSNPPEKITDNKASRLERKRKRKRERVRERYQTDPAYAQRRREYQREYQRERYQTDPDFAERQRESQREYQRERRKNPAFADRERERLKKRYKTDPAYAQRQREYQRERRKDPVFVEGHRTYMNTYRRIKKQTANKEEASKQAKIAKEQYLHSIHSDGTPPATFQSSS